MTELRQKLNELSFYEKIDYLTDKINAMKNPFLAKFVDSILDLFTALSDDYKKLDEENRRLAKEIEQLKIN